MSCLVIAARVWVAAVFLAAGTGKLRSASRLRGFAGSLAAIGVTRAGLPAAAALAALELVVGVALLVPATAPLAAIGAGALLTVFIVVIAVTVRRGTAAACRCFGADGDVLRTDHIGRNLLVLAAAAVAARPGAIVVDRPLVLAYAGVVGILLAVLVVRWDDLRFITTGRAG